MMLLLEQMSRIADGPFSVVQVFRIAEGPRAYTACGRFVLSLADIYPAGATVVEWTLVRKEIRTKRTQWQDTSHQQIRTPHIKRTNSIPRIKTNPITRYFAPTDKNPAYKTYESHTSHENEPNDKILRTNK